MCNFMLRNKSHIVKRFRSQFHLNYAKKRQILLVFTVVLLLLLYLFKNASTFLRVISAVGTLFFFYAADHLFDIRFRKRHYIFVLIIAIASFLGSPFYYVYPDYDKIQHFLQPILLCSLTFFTINKLHLELKWKITFTFFVIVALLGIFEIGEFALDSLFNLKLQGVYLRDTQGLEKFNLLMDPLKDTMVDLVYGILGSLIYCMTLAVYYRRKLGNNLLKES